jgi:hypothetical protein
MLDFHEHEIAVRKNQRRGFAGMSRQIRPNSPSSDIRRADAFMPSAIPASLRGGKISLVAGLSMSAVG